MRTASSRFEHKYVLTRIRNNSKSCRFHSMRLFQPIDAWSGVRPAKQGRGFPSKQGFYLRSKRCLRRALGCYFCAIRKTREMTPKAERKLEFLSARGNQPKRGYCITRQTEHIATICAFAIIKISIHGMPIMAGHIHH